MQCAACGYLVVPISVGLRADHLSVRRCAEDRDARDRLDHQLVHADGLREPRVLARARRDHRLPLADDALGDAAREAAVDLLAEPVARGVADWFAVVIDEDDETTLGAEQRRDR